MKTIKFLLLFIVGVMISSCTINNYYTQSQPYDDVYYNPNIHQYPDNNVQNQDYQQDQQDYQQQDNQITNNQKEERVNETIRCRNSRGSIAGSRR